MNAIQAIYLQPRDQIIADGERATFLGYWPDRVLSKVLLNGRVRSVLTSSLTPFIEPKRTIVTSYVFPPIPIRDFDWQAHFDGEEEGLVGWGRTEAEAIAELLQAVADEEDDVDDDQCRDCDERRGSCRNCQGEHAADMRGDD